MMLLDTNELVWCYSEQVSSGLRFNAPRTLSRDGDQLTAACVGRARQALAVHLAFERVRGVGRQQVMRVKDRWLVEKTPDHSVGVGELNLNPSRLRLIAHPTHCLASHSRHAHEYDVLVTA